MNVLADARLITCILPRGKGEQIHRALVEEKGIQSANIHGARGVGRFSPITSRGIGEQQEKDMLEICVSAEDADELFEFMFFAGEMDQAHGGIIYMTRLDRGMSLELPVIPAPDRN